MNIIPTVKCGSVTVWGCFAASGPGQLAIIEGNHQFCSSCTRKFLRRMSSQLFVSRSCSVMDLFSKTMIHNMKARPHLHG
uniref:Uncharacterized protein n=1 Tax=Anguilla anguilla TaxID=7936 RepID=A0A0E9WS07_ANGAN